MPPPSPRRAAAEVLVAVLDDKRPLEDALAGVRSFTALDGRDRGFARAIASASLRRLGRIDAVLAEHLNRPLPDQAKLARALLRAGAAQLLALGTPAHAVVSESVSVANADAGARSYAKLINAVLRRVSEHDAFGEASEDDWPGWLVESWRAAYGADAARAIAEASGREPPLDLTVKSDPERWAAALEGTVTPLGGVRTTKGGDPTSWEGFAEGAWWVQDAAASLPARLLLGALGDAAGARVLDLCAAPGGKTLQLAAAGARVTAVDRSARRLARLRDNLARTGLAAEVVEADAGDFEAETAFDAVLLDAPCSATGTLRRRPDVAWLKSARDVRAMSLVEARLLAAAARAAKPGGFVVFSTCSLQPEEGPGALAQALAEGAPLTIDPVRSEAPPGLPAEAIAPDGTVRTLPCFWAETGGMDGFFIARLRRSDA